MCEQSMSRPSLLRHKPRRTSNSLRFYWSGTILIPQRLHQRCTRVTRAHRAHRVQGCKSRALGKDPQSLICQATVACRIASLSDTHECIDTFPEPSRNGCPARIVLEIICKSNWSFAVLVWHGLTLCEWTYNVWCVCVCDSWKEYKSFAIASFQCVCAFDLVCSCLFQISITILRYWMRCNVLPTWPVLREIAQLLDDRPSLNSWRALQLKDSEEPQSCKDMQKLSKNIR